MTLPAASPTQTFPPGHVWSEEEERPVYMLYTAREVADELGCVERTVRRWITDGRLPATKEHGVYRILMSDAREVFNESRAGVVLERGTHSAYVQWLEAENERLWTLLEKVVTR